MVLLAMGFVGPAENDLINTMNLQKDQRGNIATDDCHMTSSERVFSAGDMRRGQSLVVWAIADGQAEVRSEKRRGGTECAAEGRSRWSPNQ